MALRLSLVIDGDASGAKKAVEDTAGAIDKLDKAAAGAARGTADTADGLADAGRSAEGAAPHFEAVSEGLKSAARDGPAAARAVRETGDAAQAASGKLGALRPAILGALGGLATGFVVGAIASGLSAAAGAAGELIREITSNAPRIERDLKAQGDLVDSIAGAFRRARGAASDYGRESRAVLAFSEQQSIARLRRDLGDQLGDITVGGARGVGRIAEERRLGPFRDEVAAFRQDLRDGNADVIAFRDNIARIGEGLATDSPFRKAGEDILAETDKAAELQSELQRAIDLYKGLSGDSDAAARALGGSADKLTLNGEAASGALPALTEYDRLLASIAGRQPAPAAGSYTPIPAGSVRPYAAGGVVTAPTLFGYGGGRLGLMGEAGPEAILPLSGGGVAAKGAGGEYRSAADADGLGSARRRDALRPRRRGDALRRRRRRLGHGRRPASDSPTTSTCCAAPSATSRRASARAPRCSARSATAAIGVSQRFLDLAFNALDNALFNRLAGGDRRPAGLGLGRRLPLRRHGRPDAGAGPQGAARRRHGRAALPRRPPAGRALRHLPGRRDHHAARPVGAAATVVNNFYIETPSPRAFAESRASVARAAGRLMSRVGRFT